MIMAIVFAASMLQPMARVVVQLMAEISLSDDLHVTFRALSTGS